MFEYWQILTGAFTLIGGAIGWIFSRKLRKADVKEKESNALQSMQKVYDVFTSHTDKQIGILTDELAQTRREVKDMRDEMRVLNKDNRQLHVEISNLHKTNNILKDRIFELEKDNNRKAQENMELRAKLKKVSG